VRLAAGLRDVELGAVVAVGLLAAGGWAAASLADQVREPGTADFDTRVILAMRDPGERTDPIGPAWVEELARDVTALGGTAVTMLLTIAVSTYLFLERKRHAAWFVLATVGGGMIAGSLLKHGFDRPRPDLVPHGARVFSSSFPSGHAMIAALTYLTLAALLAGMHRRRIVKAHLLGSATLAMLAIGASRVYLGVHWPTDVLAGWAAGSSWAALCLAPTMRRPVERDPRAAWRAWRRRGGARPATGRGGAGSRVP
jgi:undecaprenyl-diphosphatase